MQQSIGEIWARGVNDKIKKQEDAIKHKEDSNQTQTIKPVFDKEVEAKKAQFRQNILNNSLKGAKNNG